MASKQSNTPRGIRTYTGDVNEHNREHGLGFFELADGTHGAGEFDDGHLVGISVVHRSSGETYAIDRKGNDKDGNGIYVWPAKNSYDEETWYIGEFKKTKPDGFAMFKTSFGYTWIGEVSRQWMPIESKGFWVDRYDNPVELPIWIGSNEKFEGFGTLIALNGICYQGDWVNGQRHGWGIFTKPDGYRYEGEFKHNKKHGKGTFFKAKHNNVFEGEFANNLPNGNGVRYNPEGPGGPVIHRGTFKNGLYHGKGELRFSNCTSFFGTWCEGKLTEEDKVRYEKQTGAIYAE